MSKVFGICMVRDAEDIIGYIVEHMIGEVDHVIVADNLSSDNTRSILEQFGNKITLLEDNDPAYRQSEKMTYLSQVAGRLGAEWVVPFDADEWWFSDQGRLADVIRDNNYCINVASLVDHVPTSVDSDDPNPMKRMGYRRAEISPLHKVAVRTSLDLTIEMGNHNATYEFHMPTYGFDLLQIRHYPYRTPEQFVDKAVVGAAALDMTDLPYEQGQHWREYAKIAENSGPGALKEVFTKWFWSGEPERDGLVFDPVIP